MNNREAWLKRLANLNVARTQQRGLAPHKPLLLLTIMDMIEDGKINSAWIGYSPELFFRFNSYWRLVYDRQLNRPDMRMPFHALGGHRDRMWERSQKTASPLDQKKRQGFATWTTRSGTPCKTPPSAVPPASNWLPPISMRPNKSPSARTSRSPNQPPRRSRRSSTTQQNIRRASPRAAAPDSRSDVLTGYEFTCALTGYRMNTDNDHLVEARSHPQACGERGQRPAQWARIDSRRSLDV